VADNFALDISRFVEKAKIAPDIIVRKIATDLLTRVVERTPVGDPQLWVGPPPEGYVGGMLRANWNIAFGRPDKTITAVPDPSGGATISRGALKASKATAKRTIFITNNLPYVNRIEYEGWSKQAPAGMVRITVSEFQTFVDAAVRKMSSEQ
jgi:hypothetical protein